MTPVPAPAVLDWSRYPDVERVPGKVSGAWVFKDTRLALSVVFENLEAGATVDDVSAWFAIDVARVKGLLRFVATGGAPT